MIEQIRHSFNIKFNSNIALRGYPFNKRHLLFQKLEKKTIFYNFKPLQQNNIFGKLFLYNFLLF